MRKKARLLEIIRYSIIIFIFISSSIPSIHRYNQKGLYITLLIVIIFNFLWNRLGPEKFLQEKRYYLEITIDVIWLGFVQFFTGKLESPLYFLIIFPLISCALINLSSLIYIVIGESMIVILINYLLFNLNLFLSRDFFFILLVQFGLISLCSIYSIIYLKRSSEQSEGSGYESKIGK